MIVVDGDVAAFEAAVADVDDAGWRVVSGFGQRGDEGPLVRAGAVEDANDAAAALLAVLAGAGAVVHGRASREVVDRLLEDLRHVRRVEVRHEAARPAPPIDREAIAILRILAEGRTLGDAAATLGLSRRTADRRLSEARRTLGVERTIEAVSLARRRGYLG